MRRIQWSQPLEGLGIHSFYCFVSFLLIRLFIYLFIHLFSEGSGEKWVHVGWMANLFFIKVSGTERSEEKPERGRPAMQVLQSSHLG